MAARLPDPFACFGELSGFDIYAGDGHYHHAAAFDPKPNTSTGKTNATGHFFRLDMRSHHLGHLDLGAPDHGKKRTHDITVIRRGHQGKPTQQRLQSPQNPLCVGQGLHRLRHVEQPQAHCGHLLHHPGKIQQCCQRLLVQPHRPHRHAQQRDQRPITYTDLADATTYVYLTNKMKIQAYQLVIIYKHRWDTEKVFHQLKSKMEERKSWASSETAKRHNAVFECLAHNLCLLMEQEMKSRGLKDEVEGKKSQGREKTRRNREGNPMERASNLIGNAITRASQRTVRFIRWLRAALYGKGSVADAMIKLKRAWYPKKS